jgi:OPT oligopeptide transporter protein
MATRRSASSQDEEKSLPIYESFARVKDWDASTTTTTITALPDAKKSSVSFTTSSDSDSEQFNAPAETAKDLVTEVLSATDDPTLNPWTFRVWFLGMGLSTFGGSLATIYYFKPQTVFVSTVFLAVISYVLGEVLAQIIPTKGVIGKIFNPHPVGALVSLRHSLG